MIRSSQVKEVCAKHYLSRDQILKRLSGFNFIEIYEAMRFLKVFCDASLGICEQVYLRDKLFMCLQSHDDGSNAFIKLRELACELDLMCMTLSK